MARDAGPALEAHARWLATAVLALALLTGCPGDSDVAPGDVCTGFNHPLAADWAIGAVGDVLVFTERAGTTRQFQLAQIEVSDEPRVISDGARWGTCADYRIYRYEVVDMGYRLRVEFAQLRDNPDHNAVRDDFWAYVHPDTPLHERTFLFTLDEPESHGSDTGVDVGRYDPTRTIEGRTYADVFEVTLTDLSRLKPGLPEEAAWVRVVMARGIGVLQYELRDGRVFTRAPPQ